MPGLIEKQMPGPTQWVDKLREFQSQPWAPSELNANDAPQFKQWLFNTKLFNSVRQEIAEENNIPLDKLDNNRVAEMLMSSKDYDYVGAWRDGVKEEISPHDNRPHWPSKTSSGRWLKSPTHETAWKEVFMQQYGSDPDDIGLRSLEDAIRWSQKGEAK